MSKNWEMTLHDLKITKAGVDVFPNEWFTKPKQEQTDKTLII